MGDNGLEALERRRAVKKKKRFKPMAGLDPESSEKIYIFEKIRAI